MKLKSLSRLESVARIFGRNQSGAAAAEFALILVLLVVPIMNVVDIAKYVYDRTEVENGAQSAVQVAWAECAVTGLVPATVGNNCTGLSSAMSTAAASTSLGGGASGVTVTATREDYCCPNGSGSLTCEGSVATITPTACSSGENPGDYIFVTVSYTFTAGYASVAASTYLTSPITHTAWMRLS